MALFPAPCPPLFAARPVLALAWFFLPPVFTFTVLPPVLILVLLLFLLPLLMLPLLTRLPVLVLLPLLYGVGRAPPYPRRYPPP